MSDNEPTVEQIEKAKITQETAKINWLELQRFYAQGKVVAVSDQLDLVEVAYQLQQDNSAQFQEWMADNSVNTVSDEQALEWFENKQDLWAVVISPWILVQQERTVN